MYAESPLAVKQVMIRVDDVGRPDWTTYALLSMCVSLRLAATCLVVPAWLDAGMARLLQALERRAEGGLAFAQHGWTHENHAPVGERQYEFGRARSLTLQRGDIRRGRTVLSRQLGGGVPRIFSPPHNRLSQETLAALATEGFVLCLGSPRTFTGLRTPAGLQAVAFAVDAGHRVDGVRRSRSPQSIIREILSDRAARTGVVIHPQEFHRAADCARLLLALDGLRSQGVQFETVAKACCP